MGNTPFYLPLGLVSEIYVKQWSLAKKSKEITRLTVVNWRSSLFLKNVDRSALQGIQKEIYFFQRISVKHRN